MTRAFPARTISVVAIVILTMSAMMSERVAAGDETGWRESRSIKSSAQFSNQPLRPIGGWSTVREAPPHQLEETSFKQPLRSAIPRPISHRPVQRTGFYQPRATAISAQPDNRPFARIDPDFTMPPTPPHVWQVLPSGLLYKSYMAGEKESRMGTALLFDRGGDTFQESALGGRIGLIRFGTPGAIQPEGWQLDVEGAAFLRQNWTHDLDVDAVDFRIGVPLTWRRGPLAVKFGYYHISSHVGDEFLIRNPGFRRRNFVRDALLLGAAYNVTPDWLIYGEVGASVNNDGGSEPWEFQFGAEYSPIIRNGLAGSPFFAINAHLRQEFDFGGGLNVLAGWQWRSDDSDRVLRIGGQFYTGKALQYSFFNENEQLIGLGIWYDF